MLFRNNVCRRFPRIKFILSHAGGFVPYAAYRLTVVADPDDARDQIGVLDDFASFYFDTALSGSPAALPSLLAFAKPGHVLFGSDWPFAPESAVRYFTSELDAYPGMIDHDAVNRESALELFPRLVAQRSQ